MMNRRHSYPPHVRLPPSVWSKWSNERLLDLQLCNLDLKIEGTILEERIQKVREELRNRNLRFRPYFWLSDDWFTPDGCTGSAIPFYLAHPRLTSLERSQMDEVEGGTRDWCMKLLRHEVAHALDHAFILTRRRRRQRLFGLSSHSYPRFYRPNPYSKRYVQHLEYWYAQSHPDEDFAETLAVWLKPRSPWRKQYQGWPALKKLKYVDELMDEIAEQKPLIQTSSRIDHLPSLHRTLREHYALKRESYGSEYPDSFDKDLKRLFTEVRTREQRETAAAFIRRVRPELLRMVSPWTGDNRYVLDQLLKDISGRCRELKLYVKDSEKQIKVELAIVLTKQAVDYVYRRHRWVEV